MKKLITTFLLMLFFFDLMGQYDSLIVENSKWNILRQSFNPHTQQDDQYTETILFRTDTLINDTLYKNVYQSYEQNTGYSLIGQIREDSAGKVYFRPLIYENEYLLYDFGLDAGDSASVIYWSGVDENSLNIVKIRVDSILPFTYNETARLKFSISSKSQFENEWLSTNEWVSGIGDLEGILYSCHKIDVGGIDIKQLLCFTKSDGLVFKNPNYNTCFLDNTTAILHQEIDIMLFYDSSMNELILNSDSLSQVQLLIVDSMGRIVISETMGGDRNYLDLNLLSTGIYHAVLLSSNRKAYIKFIKWR